MDNKKQWEKPVIIVFTRSTAEESVLDFCKSSGFSAAVTAHGDGMCLYHPDITCSTVGTS